MSEIREVHLADELREPRLGAEPARDPRRQQAIARKLRGTTQRETERATDPLEVTPHIAPLGGVEVERRVIPTLRLEDRAEKKRAPHKLHLGGPTHFLDTPC